VRSRERTARCAGRNPAESGPASPKRIGAKVPWPTKRPRSLAAPKTPDTRLTAAAHGSHRGPDRPRCCNRGRSSPTGLCEPRAAHSWLLSCQAAPAMQPDCGWGHGLRPDGQGPCARTTFDGVPTAHAAGRGLAKVGRVMQLSELKRQVRTVLIANLVDRDHRARHAGLLARVLAKRPPAVALPDGIAADLGPGPRAQPAVQLAAAVPGSVLGAIPHCWGATSRASARLSTAARSSRRLTRGSLAKRLKPAFTGWCGNLMRSRDNSDRKINRLSRVWRGHHGEPNG
jgi:hypothetical protein